MFLLDTNVWLELLLDQEKAGEVRGFLEAHEAQQLALTDFSLHSLGVVLIRLKKDHLFLEFLADTLESSAVQLVRLDATGLRELPAVCRRFGLDFDDAYQYLAAERHNLTLVSLDSDFDRTERGRKRPAEVAGHEP